MTGGGHPPRGRPVPSCHCHPPCPSLPPAPGTPSGSRPRCCCPPPPPACVEPRPPCRVPPGLDLCPPHPRQEFSKPPCRPPPPSPPHGDNNADDQCSVEATREPSPEDDKPRDTQSVSLSSLPPRAGGGGEGAEHSTLLLPGAHSRSVRTSARSFPCRRCHCRRVFSWGGARRQQRQ